MTLFSVSFLIMAALPTSIVAFGKLSAARVRRLHRLELAMRDFYTAAHKAVAHKAATPADLRFVSEMMNNIRSDTRMYVMLVCVAWIGVARRTPVRSRRPASNKPTDLVKAMGDLSTAGIHVMSLRRPMTGYFLDRWLKNVIRRARAEKQAEKGVRVAEVVRFDIERAFSRDECQAAA